MSDLPIDNNAPRLPGVSTLARQAPLIVATLLPCVLLLWFSAPTLVLLQQVWLTDDAYSHGYLVPAAAAFLIARELREGVTPLDPRWAGFVCLLFLAVVIFAAQAATMPVVAYAALPALWIAAVWALAGASYAKRLALPLSFLYSAIPIWDLVGEPLRRLTIGVVTIAVRATKIPAFIEGNFIQIPSGTFEVVGGCGGLRYAIVGGTLGAFAGLLHRRWAATLILTSSALGLALIANWLRVFTMVAVGYYSEMKHPLIVGDHILFGWVVFLVCMAPLLYVDRKLSKTATRQEGARPRVERAKSAAYGRGLITLSVSAVALLGVGLDYRAASGSDSPAEGVALAAPEIPGWRRVANWDDARRPDFIGSTAQVAQWYDDGAARVGAYLAHYAHQSQGREVVFTRNRPEGAATVVARRAVDIPSGLGAALVFEEIEVAGADIERRLIWVQLRIGGSVAASPVAAKLHQVVGAISGRRDAQALVFTAVCTEGCGDARASLSLYAKVATARFYEEAERARVPSESGDLRGGSL